MNDTDWTEQLRAALEHLGHAAACKTQVTRHCSLRKKAQSIVDVLGANKTGSAPKGAAPRMFELTAGFFTGAPISTAPSPRTSVVGSCECRNNR